MDLRIATAAAVAALLLVTAFPTEVDARLKPKKPYKVHWTEHNGYIDTASVCNNFARSTIEFRQCRSYAVDVFKHKCRKYKRRYHSAGYATKARERSNMLKFCSASRRFSP